MVSPRALSFAAIRSAWGSNSCIITGPPVVAASTLPVPPPALQELVSRGATRMARDGDFPSSGPITERILAIRDRWQSIGQPMPEETVIGVNIGYATAVFAVPDDAPSD